MNTIRVKREITKNIYVHNDLLNAARYFIDRTKERLDKDDREGIFHEHLACLVMLAFGFEATINFFGHKLIPNWKERAPFHLKVDNVLEHLGLNPDRNIRPYSSIQRLKDFRDLIAHGKPDESYEIRVDEVSVDDFATATWDPHELDGNWEEICTHENVSDIYEDIMAINKELLQQSGLEISDMDTHGHGSATIIDKK